MEFDKESLVNNPNDVSISDAETESDNEHEDDINKPEEQEEVTAPPVAKKHGRKREPWVQKPIVEELSQEQWVSRGVRNRVRG